MYSAQLMACAYVVTCIRDHLETTHNRKRLRACKTGPLRIKSAVLT